MTGWLSRIGEIFTLGVKNLLRNKLRSFLTMLGMIFGVGSVIAMLSVGAGARHEILARIQQLGVRNIIINSIKPPEQVKPADSENEGGKDEYGLTFEDADYIIDTVPAVERLFRVNKVKQRVWYGSRRLESTVMGVEPDHLEMFGHRTQRGRLLNRIDNATTAKVCVVRQGLVRQLETVEDPIGMWLQIGDHPFQVVGILEDEQFQSHARKALAIDGRLQEVYIPYSTSMRTFGTVTYVEKSGSTEFTEVDLDQMVVTTNATESVLTTSRVISAALKHFHEETDYEIVVPLELLQQSEQTQRVFNIVMILIAGISLIVGGIGIANIMLATITERTREIGVRRALGAKRADIVVQFLTETTAIALIGGILGCALGIGGIFGIMQYTNWKALIAPHYVLVSMGISCAVGIVFGIFPARRASLMDPITALRTD